MAGFNLADYEPVEDRLAKFWADHPNGRVVTQLVTSEGGQFIVKASLYREGDLHPFSVGYAEEQVSTRGVNQTSALENCETSSIGRALANAGYAPKGKRPSREEMTKVERRQASEPLSELKSLLAQKFTESADRKTFLEEKVGRELSGASDLTADEVTSIINELKGA